MAAKDGARRALVIIDPQNDFCDPRGSLFVPGAEEDMRRLADHIRAEGASYGGIFISLDSHDVTAIFHPKYWRGRDGAPPAPFTAITGADCEDGTWRPASPENEAETRRTFGAMARKKIDALTIWPEHCVVSTWGHQICAPLLDAFAVWREAAGRAVRYFFKGENPYTEQFSVFEGIDDTRPDMRFRDDLFARLAENETVTFAGEALSHCVEASIVSYMTRARTHASLAGRRVELLADCASPVAGFDREASERRIAGLGVVLTKSQ
jgi:nicotinamidase-related amidase